MANQHSYSPSVLIKVRETLDKLARSEIKAEIVESPFPPPPFRGRGKIKLIILGQDPTVQDPESRKNVRVTLILDQPGRLRTYAEKICNALDIDLDENIYATNLLKNFFRVPPDSLRKKDPQFFQKAADLWIPVLKKEIGEFENVPILPLGEPVLNALTDSPNWTLIRNYWGYEGPGKYGQKFGYIKPTGNILARTLFPFPHLPGLTHKIYGQQMAGYLAFLKKEFFR
jgi:uracil-DNA glycosylase